MIECDFKNIRKFNKEVFDKIRLIEKEFNKEGVEILEERTKENCPDSNQMEKDVKDSITILSENERSGIFEAEIGTDGNNNALMLHEAPRNKNSSDKNTQEGGQGNKFLSRTANFHFGNTFPKLIVDKNREKGLI